MSKPCGVLYGARNSWVILREAKRLRQIYAKPRPTAHMEAGRLGLKAATLKVVAIGLI
jgi:hypothetical protein